MKKLIVFFAALAIVMLPAHVVALEVDDSTIGTITMKSDGEDTKGGICPKTNIKGDRFTCFECHSVPSMKLIEADPNEGLKLPARYTKVRGNALYYNLTSISDMDVENIFDYARTHDNIDKVVFDIFSPGGSVMRAWKIVGLMNQYKDSGGIVETRCFGYAASAGFLILASGSQGHRYAAETAELMWHEIQSFKQWDFSDTSKKEDEAAVLRHFQDVANNWLAKVSLKTKDEIDAEIKHKAWWMSGVTAIEYGFVDGLPK